VEGNMIDLVRFAFPRLDAIQVLTWIDAARNREGERAAVRLVRMLAEAAQ